MCLTTLTNADNLQQELTFPQLLQEGQTVFGYHGVDFYVLSTENNLVIYSSDTEATRQIYSVSKSLDYTDVALANRNLRLTLETVTKQSYWSKTDNFRIYRNQEIHLSPAQMSYSQCQLYCARYDAAPIYHVDQFYDLMNSFNPSHVWVDATTSVETLDDKIQYKVHLGKVELFPDNQIGLAIPKIYHYFNHERVEIFDIKALYSYYESQAAEYWTKHHYKLNTVLTSDGSVLVYIPQDPRHLINSDYFAYCGCQRDPSLTTKIYNDLYQDFQILKNIQNDLNIDIENVRLSSTNEAGSLIELIKPYMTSHISHKNFTKRYVALENVSPLIKNSGTHQELLHTLVLVGAKKIGSSVAMSLLASTLKHVKKTYGATILQDAWKDEPQRANYFDLSNMQMEKNNFSLVVKFPKHHLDSFAYNVSNDLHLADTLVKNLTIVNKELQSLLHNHAQNLLLNLAKDDLINPIDYNAPILAAVKPGKSYIFIQFFITTISNDNLITHYKSNGLPTHSDGEIFFALDVPHTFSASVDASSSFRFTDENTQARESCVHAFLGMDTKSLNSQCQATEFSNKKLLVLQRFDTFRLLYARGKTETLKLSCLRSAPLYHSMAHDIMIFLAPMDCEINLISSDGIFTIQRNLTTNSNLVPRFLFHYDLDSTANGNYYQWMIIIILSIITSLLLLTLAAFAFLVYKNKISTEIEEENEDKKDISPCEQNILNETSC